MTWRPFVRFRLTARITRALGPFLAVHNLNLENLRVQGGDVRVILAAKGDEVPLSTLAPRFEDIVRAVWGVRHVQVMVVAARSSEPAMPQRSTMAKPRQPPSVIPGLAVGVHHMIAVASGKGGVGKSTVAVNLAVALARQRVRVGLLDADIYGPSVPTMMGIKGQKPVLGEDKKLRPIMAHGVACMSMGMLVEADAPMIWRGPMVQTAIVQLLRDVDWRGVDVMIIDLPPGTGDAQLTIAQKIKLTGAIIVSTPQDVALIDARKGLEMFRKTDVPILGMVENMSVFCCPNCGQASPIFGAGGARDMAAREGVPFLGAIPIDAAVRERGDSGVPEPGAIYQDIARGLWTRIIAAHNPETEKAAGPNDLLGVSK